MNRIIAGFAAALVAGMLGFGGTASAAGFTINFTGVVTSAFDVNGGTNLPGEVGKGISGSLSYGGNVTDFTNPPFNDEGTSFDQTTWSVTVGSAPKFTESEPAGEIVFLHHGNDVEALFDTNHVFSLDLHWNPSTQLASLATFPADDVAAAIFFGTPMSSASGGADVTTSSSRYFYQYTITSFTTATTPLPASACMFVTALGGLGWAGWRRRAPAPSALPAA